MPPWFWSLCSEVSTAEFPAQAGLQTRKSKDKYKAPPQLFGILVNHKLQWSASQQITVQRPRKPLAYLVRVPIFHAVLGPVKQQSSRRITTPTAFPPEGLLNFAR